MPLTPTFTEAGLSVLARVTVQPAQQGRDWIAIIPAAPSRVDASELTRRYWTTTGGVNTYENDLTEPVIRRTPVPLTPANQSYITRLDLGGGYPDNLIVRPSPAYPTNISVENPQPDFDSYTRVFELRWRPTAEQCMSPINPNQRLWQFTATLVSDFDSFSLATPIYFNVIAESRTLVREEIRGSTVGGPDEEVYGPYPHFPLPWFKVDPDTGKLDVESAIAPQFFASSRSRSSRL